VISKSYAMPDNKFRPQTRPSEAKTPLAPSNFVPQRAKHENTYTTREGRQTKKKNYTTAQRNATRHNATQGDAMQRRARERSAANCMQRITVAAHEITAECKCINVSVHQFALASRVTCVADAAQATQVAAATAAIACSMRMQRYAFACLGVLCFASQWIAIMRTHYASPIAYRVT
jgi:hypothetical protein